MNRIIENRRSVEKWINVWSPNVMKKYQDYLKVSSQCTIIFNDGQQYEIDPGDDRHIFFLDKIVCTCRV